MKKKIKKRKGAALLTAILLSTIVGVVAIGVNAIAVRQVNISETYNNGVFAFYSAESGIEEGLLRFRFNKNAEIPLVPTTEDTKLGRTPLKKSRSFLNQNPMTNFDSTDLNTLYGVDGFYLLPDRQQIYDLQMFYKQKYFGVDANDNGFIDQEDFIDLSRFKDNFYKLTKDEQKDFTITGGGNDNENNKIFLFWRWNRGCTDGTPGRALEVRLKVDTAASGLPADRDEYTALFKDPTCPSSIANADLPVELGPGVFTPIGSPGDLKSKMNISSLTVTSMSLKSIGGSNNDTIAFGFNQGSPSGGSAVSGPTTTIKSLGYFGGVSREIVAEIDRQNGSILDLFNYVLYKGGE